MPTYEYLCRRCNHIFEKRMTVEEKTGTTVSCPECHSEEVRQQFFGLSFSGKKSAKGNSSGGCCEGGPSCCG
jgi:putative FmdB family regulatory protein